VKRDFVFQSHIIWKLLINVSTFSLKKNRLKQAEESTSSFWKIYLHAFQNLCRQDNKTQGQKLTLTATASYDVLQERVLRGYQAPAAPWHPFFVEWSRILVAAVAIRISASLYRLVWSQAVRDTWWKSFVFSFSLFAAFSSVILPRMSISLDNVYNKSDDTPHALKFVRDVARTRRFIIVIHLDRYPRARAHARTVQHKH